MQTKHYIWLAAVIGVLVGVGGWLLFAPAASAPSSSATSTATTTDQNGVGVGATGSTTVTDITGTANATKPPALRSINVASSVSADVKTALQAQYAAIAAQLSAEPSRVDLWLQLGMLYKIGGDYPGAIGAWSYVAAASPSSTSYVAYGNLGDLYLNFIHDYPKAEANYKAALDLRPGNADYTAGLQTAQQLQGK